MKKILFFFLFVNQGLNAHGLHKYCAVSKSFLACTHHLAGLNTFFCPTINIHDSTGVLNKPSPTIPCSVKEDFNYKIDLCNPLVITLQASTSVYNTIEWQIDDGTLIKATTTPSHTFANTGNHAITMIINKGYCADTTVKAISLNIQSADVILTPDTTICAGTATQLRTQPSLGFCWSPAKYLNNPNTANPVTTTPENITYYYTAQVPGSNLIINGDFSQGNMGFTSAYTYANPNLTEGQYFVGPNPSAWNPSLSPCSGHTTGNDNMLLMNGSPTPDVNVWKQTITVIPNTNYAFSTWVQALWPPNPAQLQFSINGIEAGILISASLPTCTWTQFFTTWNSGSNTSAVISIVNKNTAIQGNDFALDDISFAPIIVARDSVVIKIDSVLIRANNDTTVCNGNAVQLHANGNATSFSWSPTTGLSNAGIANPVAAPTNTTTYIVTVANTNGCMARDTVVINIAPAMVHTPIKKFASCNGSALRIGTGIKPASYLWNNGAVTDSINATNTGIYWVETSYAGCSNRDSFNVAFENISLKTNNDTTVCAGTSVLLNTTGAATYLWTPPEGLSVANIPDPVAKPLQTTQYIVTGTSTNGCIARDTLRLTVESKPVINRTMDTTICHDKTLQLNAAGGTTYLWSPSATLTNSTISNPVASPAVATTYYLKVTNSSNCSNTDSVKIGVIPVGIFNVSPAMQTCVGTPVRLSATGGTSYAWLPAGGLDNAGISSPSATPLLSTMYTVKMKNVCNDSAILTTMVTILPLPNVAAVSTNDITCTTPSSQLTASGALTYLWQPSAGLNDSLVASPVASPVKTTEYRVKGTDANGCSSYSKVSVMVDHTGDLTINMPNAFSPNGDRQNDCFGVSKYAGLLQQTDLSVYDRFGVRVFHTNNPQHCWDGRYNGKLQDAGGFVYLLKALTYCGTISKKGIVMLMK